MNIIAINGSPRKKGNTSTLLKKALEGAKAVGAKVELINLYDLNFKGCISCFACKRVNSKSVGKCAMKDGLTDVLNKIIECDVLILGSPIYLGNVTGEMKSFMERLLFMNLSYDGGHSSNFNGKISTAFIYTMNVPESIMIEKGYENVFKSNDKYLQLLNGPSEYLISNDTYQFDDYSKYNASDFDENHKSYIKKTQFLIDCQKAFKLGVRLSNDFSNK
ncbi:flavodoxin family protein [Tepidibacter hydrothermalis]|uniref:Flavodoxin family protein n=1 Tax=Tepidibacter hydrothermalis TaxID=3036126 RepID=A0ABY8E7D8_9FIRM|nr:flavodoxin family protein [Tepidibacter hydrothermalis]WFD08816.1 flavodoxin family protein [Tepidibacter hydrothermalis]